MTEEEKKEFTEEEFAYVRYGHIDRDRPVDKFVKSLTEVIPGDGVLPLRWGWRSREKFLDRYGDLGNILWAKATSSHLLMVDGTHIFRFWTDSANSAVVDVCIPLAAKLGERGWDVEDIPETVMRKCKPFTKRVRVASQEDVDELLQVIMGGFG